jgi:hypothetical protein
MSRSNSDGNFFSGGFHVLEVGSRRLHHRAAEAIEARAMKEVKDLIQIMYQIAVSVGVLVVAF